MMEQFYFTHNVTLTSTIPPGQSRPKSNGNEDVFHIPQTPGV